MNPPHLTYATPRRIPNKPSRFFPLVCFFIWPLTIGAILFFFDQGLFDKLTLLVLITSFGLGIPLIALVSGLRVFQQTQKAMGRRDRFLSITLALQFVLLIGFGFFLLLIWPIVLKSP